ncbi:MAG: chordopoxvirus fusion protein [Thermoanaerobacteraceae bacterium]|nr:chordopoxvirus fusion protein [Thermoanaerobacteraceae bacterium]
MQLQTIQRKLAGVFLPEQATVLAEVIHEAYTDLVKTGDFNELKEIVRDLSVKMGELAEAQKETQKEVGRLDRALQELAEAQKRTEQRVEELAEAQKRTEEELRKLIGEHNETRKQLGGLSTTVGYRLEDEAFKALPGLLKKDFGLSVRGRLLRKYVKDNRGRHVEVNIIGEGEKNGEVYTIVGESKSQLSKGDVDDFIRRRLNRLEGVFPKIFPVLVTYMISQPDAEDYAREKGIAVYYSYDF